MHTARLISQRSLPELLERAITARAVGLVLMRCREGLRHGVWVEDGYVVGVHVAGRFDPLLALLLRGGALSANGHRRCMEALYETGDRAGVVATRVAGVAAPAVREALEQQLVGRYEALLELAEEQGFDTRLEPCVVPASERIVRMPLGSLQRRIASRATAHPTCPDNDNAECMLGDAADGSSTTAPDVHAARRALRTLARALHPDLHAHLDPESRARLSEQLASATAAYHGFSR